MQISHDFSAESNFLTPTPMYIIDMVCAIAIQYIRDILVIKITLVLYTKQHVAGHVRDYI